MAGCAILPTLDEARSVSYRESVALGGGLQVDAERGHFQNGRLEVHQPFLEAVPGHAHDGAPGRGQVSVKPFNAHAQDTATETATTTYES